MEDPVSARDHFPSVVTDGREEVKEYLSGKVKPRQSVRRGAELLEMEECSALMYASCAWFWEDMSRVETVQMLRFARRAMELAGSVAGGDLEGGFRRRLTKARPNDPRFKDGAELYDRLAVGSKAS